MANLVEMKRGKAGQELMALDGRSLDPADWKAFRKQSKEMLGDMLEYIQHIRQRPVWQPIPDAVRANFRVPLPHGPTDLSAVHEEFMQNVLPYATGNVHPGFTGWVHGGGTAVGMVAEMLAAGLNANLGGRDHAPMEVERQVVQWVREIFGFPETSTGLFVTGTSIANLIAVLIARNMALGNQVRGLGVASSDKKLTAYASGAVHTCIVKALDISGVGCAALRAIETDERHRMKVDTLAQWIERDRAAGMTPFIVVGTAGTVDTGAVDDLVAIADLCEREKIWFHVDGAYGALGKLSPDIAPMLNGIERADSLAFDFHKWGQVPYDAGFILVRDGERHKNSFASMAAYLEPTERGLAAGGPWPCDFGPDLSRSFRALKTWFTLKTYGVDTLGEVISHCCQLAKYLESIVRVTPELELLAPVELNIVCFRYRHDDADKMNAEIVAQLQESGVAAPSTTRIGGKLAVRAAIVNHRTTYEDIEKLVENTLSIGRTLKVNAERDKLEKILRLVQQQLSTQEGHDGMRAALKTVETALESLPESSALLFLRGNLLDNLGRSQEAIDAYVGLLKVMPSHLAALNNLGNLLFAAGNKEMAKTLYKAAVEQHPNDAMSRVNLANLLIQGKEQSEARLHFERALMIDPNYRQAHAGLSFIYKDLGNAYQASVHRRAAFNDRCVVELPYRGEGQPITVLELVSAAGGGIRIKGYLSDRAFKVYLVATEFYNSSVVLPPHDLVVNAIGDVDVDPEALSGAQALLAHTNAPVINPPAAVMPTSREDIARRLAGVAGVISPKTVTWTREALTAADGAERLKSEGFVFPLLLRTPGFHGGENFVRVESAAGLADAVAELPGETLTVIEYLDARGADGKSRKYRVMMIDGKLYPLHCAISSNWKIHYFSAEMSDSAEHRAEDGRFIENMAEVLGPRAVAALEEIMKTLALDYGGIDFGLDAKGNVLLFEANATMAVIPPDAEPMWDYRRPAFERIYRAVLTMLMERAKLGKARHNPVAPIALVNPQGHVGGQPGHVGL